MRLLSRYTGIPEDARLRGETLSRITGLALASGVGVNPGIPVETLSFAPPVSRVTGYARAIAEKNRALLQIVAPTCLLTHPLRALAASPLSVHGLGGLMARKPTAQGAGRPLAQSILVVRSLVFRITAYARLPPRVPVSRYAVTRNVRSAPSYGIPSHVTLGDCGISGIPVERK